MVTGLGLGLVHAVLELILAAQFLRRHCANVLEFGIRIGSCFRATADVTSPAPVTIR